MRLQRAEFRSSFGRSARFELQISYARSNLEMDFSNGESRLTAHSGETIMAGIPPYDFLKYFPATLTDSDWQKRKGKIGKMKKTGLGAELKKSRIVGQES